MSSRQRSRTPAESVRHLARRARALALRPGLLFASPGAAALTPTFAAWLRGRPFRRKLRRARAATTVLLRSLLRLGRRVVTFALAPASVGAMYVLTLTCIGLREPVIRDRERVLGDDTSRVTAWVVVKYADTIRTVGLEILLVAALFGALLGSLVGAAVGGRGNRLSRPAAVLALTAMAHAAIFAWSMDRNPQFYDTWYARGGILRDVQLWVTSVAHPWIFPAAATAVLLGIMLTHPRAPRPGPTAIVLALAGALLLVPPTGSAARTTRDPRPNLVILAADSFRDDALNPTVMPHMTELASRGTRFTRAYVTTARTFPSWTSLLTGLEPHHHGVRSTLPRHEDIARPFDTMVTRLRRAGWSTKLVADYAGDIFRLADYGFESVNAPRLDFRQIIRVRGFQKASPLLPVLHSRAGRRAFPAMREVPAAADPDMLADDAIEAIRATGGRPFVLLVFFSAAHFPYASPAPYYKKFTDPAYVGDYRYEKAAWYTATDPDAHDIRQIRGLYDGAMASIDAAAARITGELARDGLDKDTVVVVTADHGEDLFDGDRWHGHGDHLLGDEQNHIPLAIFDPRGRTVATVPDLVRDVDFAPTLCALAGVDPPRGDGRSLIPALHGGSLEPRPVFAETGMWVGPPKGFPANWRVDYPTVVDTADVDSAHGDEIVLRREFVPMVTFARHRMVFDGRWKLIYVPTAKGPQYFLFDTVADPENHVDRSAQQPEIATHLRQVLWQWMLRDPKMEERRAFLAPVGIHLDVVDGVTNAPASPP